MEKEIPIVCTLTDKELQVRRKDILQKMAYSLIGFDELEDGFSYRFPAEDTVLQELTDIINLERKCCPFLNFKLSLEADKDFVSLELTGQEGTKEILNSLFNQN